MKKGLLVALCLLAAANLAFAGGILSNTNQSAQFVRMLARGATTDIDAAYYNPAGLVQMGDGFHVAFFSQTIGQTKTIESTYPLFGQPKTYTGEVFAPVFPDLYAVYKKGKLALNFGFGPHAGGGSADYDAGLPSFEEQVAQLKGLTYPPPVGLGMLTTQYAANINFSGSSAFLGFQLGASYAVTQKLGVSLGARYLMAKNTYEGSITDIKINTLHPQLNPTGAMVSATTFFHTLYLGAMQAGQPQQVTAALMALEQKTADKSVDAEQTGSGITPIIGVNYQFNEQWNVAVKYEGMTAVDLTNKTTKDDTGMFPDGAKTNSDIPAMLAGGVSYKPIPKLLLAVSGNYYFDDGVSWVNWGSSNAKPDGNTWEAQIGAQYALCAKWAVSAGYSRTQVYLPAEFQTDLNHELSSNTVGLGLCYQLLPALVLDLGGLYTLYDSFERPYTSQTLGKYTETFKRDAWDVAVGVGYSF
jgi:long-chain fatty acid transport protein